MSKKSVLPTPKHLLRLHEYRSNYGILFNFIQKDLLNKDKFQALTPLPIPPLSCCETSFKDKMLKEGKVRKKIALKNLRSFECHVASHYAHLAPHRDFVEGYKIIMTCKWVELMIEVATNSLNTFEQSQNSSLHWCSNIVLRLHSIKEATSKVLKVEILAIHSELENLIWLVNREKIRSHFLPNTQSDIQTLFLPFFTLCLRMHALWVIMSKEDKIYFDAKFKVFEIVKKERIVMFLKFISAKEEDVKKLVSYITLDNPKIKVTNYFDTIDLKSFHHLYINNQ
jgi:hypothetical protein